MNGVYYLANDDSRDWLLAALESLRAKGCTLPICMIPLDDNIGELRKLATRYGLQFLDSPVLQELDRAGKRWHADDTFDPRKFRKFAVFWGPFDHFIYCDIDVVALMNWDELMQAYLASGSKFWYFDRSPNDVYHLGPLLDELRRTKHPAMMNLGVFASSRDVLKYERVLEMVKTAYPLKSQFSDAGGEQGLINYFIDMDEIPVESASAHVPNLWSWTWAPSGYRGRYDVFQIADREGTFEGKRFPFIHWANFSILSYMPNSELYFKYRLHHASLADRVRYGLSWRVKPAFGNILRALRGTAIAGASNQGSSG